jgi:hypothetical protein
MVKGALNYGVSLPKHVQGVPPFKNAQIMVDFSGRKCVSGLEMMGFFLQYDLGITKNVL